MEEVYTKNPQRKVRIALTARRCKKEKITWIGNGQCYLDAITQAGAIAVTVYFQHEKEADEIAECFDGLLVTGGEDINPSLYGQKPIACEEMMDRGIEQMDLHLIRAFHHKRKPILGICRGMQCINVAFGGTLIQDIKKQRGLLETFPHQQHKQHPQNPYEDFIDHHIICTQGTQLHAILGDNCEVNSFHHQCVDRLADHFIASAVSAKDGIIEGMEKGNVIGVQWHPEWLLSKAKHRRLFRYFVTLCYTHVADNEKVVE